MRRFLPLLLVLATLSGAGVFEALGFEAEACEDGAEGCTDCAEGCAVCLCCPRVVEPAQATQVAILMRAPQRVERVVPAPRDSGFRSDIFQPPRA